MELRAKYYYDPNDRYDDEYKSQNTHIKCVHKGFCKISPMKMNSKFNVKLNTNFIRTYSFFFL